jgi:hypothetical protein
MGNPEHPEPTPEREDLTPERRTTRTRRTLVVATGAATVLAGGTFLVAQTRDASQESLPGPQSLAVASETAGETAPTPVTSEGSIPSTASEPTRASSPAEIGESKAGGSGTGDNPAPKERSAKEVREEIDKARAKAKADGFDIQRPLKAKSGSTKAEEAVSQWTESIKNGTVRVTTARHDLTDSSALLPAGNRGKSVGDGVKCTNKVRFTQDAPATERPTLLVCWRTSSKRSVVTMMATPQGVPSAAPNISIINREWAKLR